MSHVAAGMQYALGAAIIWLSIQAARQAARHWHDHPAGRLAHPEQPVCLVRHDHKGRPLADHLRTRLPDTPDADLAAMCAAFAAVTRTASRRHGSHAADVLLCDLDGAFRELTSIERTEAPQ